ncbi:hypothetical protein [Pedobacter rhodius]|uniref:Lipocalin-like domain-containing protein n=1 Tax=Pedobacter rhodius TaxID=3004098 RepID=A0ABT4KW99_9SPHI|nr:hypothetical protein [Pedobacter sp. SJ11]MCZ4223209.1 hypothetical protein [Pedobacter sp. SJ11]
MKSKILLFIAFTFLYACKEKSEQAADNEQTIQGTWRLVSGKIVDKNSGKTSNYPMDFQMIKIINRTHFAFLKHSLNLKDSTGFDAGGGSYSFDDGKYTEHLEYYSNKNWEGKTFDFKLSLINDTLIQTGVEKVEKEGIERRIIEKYIKEIK